MKILVTGAAGFIGFHLSKALINRGFFLVAIDNLNEYYDQNLKKSRLQILRELSKECKTQFSFFKEDITNKESIKRIFSEYNFTHVINLAAQAGVRYSIENPQAYIDSNLIGFFNILELSKHYSIKHFVYASSSSVYGSNTSFPFSEENSVDHPISLYAATKKSNEIIAHSYSHLYKLPTTGLRFFTVYGPWGRPDMALFKFTKNILEGNPIDIYNKGEMIRDFTYVDDVISCILRIIDKIPEINPSYNHKDPKPFSSSAPYKIFNIGNANPVNLNEFIEIIEKELDIKAKKNFLPMQAGDVSKTASDTNLIEKYTGFRPETSIEEGVKKFISWYKNYYFNE
tara:strand:- start:28 stop:1053 length:1026 start_codon:yes stop_codon:yes gene_type:complete